MRRQRLAQNCAADLRGRIARPNCAPREEGSYLGVGAQREVGVAQVDDVLEVQLAREHRRHHVEVREHHRPARPHHVARPPDEVDVGPRPHAGAQRGQPVAAQLGVGVQHEQVGLVRARVAQRARPLQRHHVAVDRLVRVRAARHDEVDEAHGRPAARGVGERQRRERVDPQLGQRRLPLEPRRDARGARLRYGAVRVERRVVVVDQAELRREVVVVRVRVLEDLLRDGAVLADGAHGVEQLRRARRRRRRGAATAQSLRAANGAPRRGRGIGPRVTRCGRCEGR